MNDLKLSEKEVKLITELREKEATEEAKRQATVGLEEKFRAAVVSAHSEIDGHLNAAKASLEMAVSVAEKHGIPFSTQIVNMNYQRRYTPKTFSKKWNQPTREGNIIVGDIMNEFDLYNTSESGWEHWNTSSLTC